MKDSPGPIATRLLFENDRLRVWEMSLAPGMSSEWHSHLNDYAFLNLLPCVVELRQAGNPPHSRTLAEGFVEYVAVGPNGQLAHQLANAGDTPLKQILFELLGPSASSSPTQIQNNAEPQP